MSTVKEMLANREALIEMVLVRMVATGITKLEMARAIGISFLTLDSFLKSSHPISTRSLMRIIKYLGVDDE